MSAEHSSHIGYEPIPENELPVITLRSDLVLFEEASGRTRLREWVKAYESKKDSYHISVILNAIRTYLLHTEAGIVYEKALVMDTPKGWKRKPTRRS